MSNPNRTSLFSKFKTWLSKSRIAAIMFPAIVLLLLAAVLVIVYGNLAGWDFSEIFTSQSAVLVYSLISITALILVIRLCNRG